MNEELFVGGVGWGGGGWLDDGLYLVVSRVYVMLIKFCMYIYELLIYILKV